MADGGVATVDARAHFRQPKALKLTNRTAQFAVAAASIALAQGAWPDDDAMAEHLGVIIGVSGSDLQVEDVARALRSDGAPTPVSDIPVFAEQILARLNPLWLLVNLPNMPSAHVAIQLGARGPNSTVMTDWVAGSQAIGEAADWIRHGEADAALAGGSDSLMQPFALAAYHQAGLMATAPDGEQTFAPSEGAAVLLLEERAHAIARGATVLGEITGYASASAAIDTHPSALVRTMASALHESGWTPSDVDAIVMASREGSRCRAAEDAAIRELLGDRASAISRADAQVTIGHAAAALGPIGLCQYLNASASCSRWLSNAMGFSGQAVTLAIANTHATEAAR